jgi:XisH protein/XisI protein
MGRKDAYHDAVKRALVRDGWRISHDPFPITYEGATVSTDLGAEKVIESEGQRIAIEIIAVEVKDFDSKSLISEFENAIVFHARLCDGKFFIEDDRTEEGIANLLLQAGIEEDDIRLDWAGIHHNDEQVSIAA